MIQDYVEQPMSITVGPLLKAIPNQPLAVVPTKIIQAIEAKNSFPDNGFHCTGRPSLIRKVWDQRFFRLVKFSD